MKPKEYNSLGLVLNISVPESVEEFDANAKRTGATLEEAINNVIYRGFLTGARSLFLHGQDADETSGTAKFEGLEQRTGVSRKKEQKGVRKSDNTPIFVYAETEQEYFDRVCAEKGVEASHYQSLMNEVVELIEFDASARERKGPSIVKLGKNWLDAADALIKKGDFSLFQKNYHKFTGKELILPEVPGSDATDEAKNLYQNKFGRLLKEMYDAKTKQELESSKLV